MRISDWSSDVCSSDLTYSRISAAEIAYQLGFKDPASLSRFFRRSTRKSPVEFRRSPSSFEMSDATVRATRGAFTGTGLAGSSFRHRCSICAFRSEPSRLSLTTRYAVLGPALGVCLGVCSEHRSGDVE